MTISYDRRATIQFQYPIKHQAEAERLMREFCERMLKFGPTGYVVQGKQYAEDDNFGPALFCDGSHQNIKL